MTAFDPTVTIGWPRKVCTVHLLAVVYRSLGMVLLVAAALKIHAFIVGQYDGPLRRGNAGEIAVAILIGFEVFLGLWLLSGVFSMVARWIAAFSFIGFAGVSIYHAVSGNSACGCFGSLRVSPWLITAFDLIAVSLLVWLRTQRIGPPVDHRRQRLFGVGILYAAALLATATGMLLYRHRPSHLGVTGTGTMSSVVVLKPAEWLGAQFPLLQHVDMNAELSRGQWLVILVAYDCPTCLAILPQFEQLAHDLALQPTGPRVALVEVPTDGHSQRGQVRAGPHCVVGRLTTPKTWVVNTPVAVALRDGEVVSVFLDARDLLPPS